jgi:hypothetical protein
MHELLWQIKSISFEDKLKLAEFFTIPQTEPVPQSFQEQSWTTNMASG